MTVPFPSLPAIYCLAMVSTLSPGNFQCDIVPNPTSGSILSDAMCGTSCHGLGCMFDFGQDLVFLVFCSLLCAAVIIYVSVPYRICNNLRRTKDTPNLNAPLAALSTLFSPATSRWPNAFLHLARQSLHTHDTSITIPLSLLYTSVKSGHIELRTHGRDLVSLLHGELCVDGWKIRLKVDGSWRRQLLWATLLSRVTASKYEARSLQLPFL